ncbi:MAG TPA: aromatic aminobenezylarsenical efflux permease ArsG family transporter [Pirellulaceae bacterium]|nr:aromatic aminobenezylarsenical efflux permease ArsG family transporter [Pirellulaceae bacterium]
MNTLLLATGSSLWLGILTSISPCPLATNIAAISYVGRSVDRTALVLASSVFYTFGRIVAYAALGAIIVASLLSAPGLSVWLQKYLNLFLGPFLVLAGMVVLGLVELPAMSGVGMNRLQVHVEKWGLAGSGLLGLLFALSFCPVSAALFFGSLIPLAIAHESSVLLPAVYGVGTGIPVVVFAVMLVFGKKSLGKFFGKVTGAEKWLRTITGVSVLLVGIYITLQQVYGI